jgi:ABC-type multidrug transport system ATPase subunit
MTESLAIEARGLEKAYGRTRALDGLDLDVEKGAILGMLGPNGAGKTTAVRVLTTLLRPDRGTAWWRATTPSPKRRRCAAGSA